MKKSKKKQIVYLEDKGETVYSMAALEGRTPEEQEEYDRKRKNRISAAFSVYGPILLICVAAFSVAALLMYLFLR